MKSVQLVLLSVLAFSWTGVTDARFQYHADVILGHSKEAPKLPLNHTATQNGEVILNIEMYYFDQILHTSPSLGNMTLYNGKLVASDIELSKKYYTLKTLKYKLHNINGEKNFPLAFDSVVITPKEVGTGVPIRKYCAFPKTPIKPDEELFLKQC